MCFSFATKTMAGDANQLQDLREFLLAGDGDSARRLTENLNPSSVINVENVDFTKLPKDILGTSLIPVIDEPGHDDHRITAQATGNGNCLYNSTSLSLCGNESPWTSLRLLVASELFFNAEFYATHEAFKRTAELTKIPENVLFPVALTANGDRAIANSGSRIDVVKAEAVATCKDKEWGSLIHMMAMASVSRQPVYSLYPEKKLQVPPTNDELAEAADITLW